MKLIKELNEEVEYFSEAKEDGSKNLYIRGVFMQCIPNKNGRIYPEAVLHKEVKRYVEEAVNKNRAVGELGHPIGPQINLDRVSHLIESLKIDGKNVMGSAKITQGTPMGDTVAGLMKNGIKLGVSTRGLGTLKATKEDLMEVQDDFRLITAGDIVYDPSAPDAFVEGIMENVDWVYDPYTKNWRSQEVLENAKKFIRTLTTEERLASNERIFKAVLDSLVKTNNS
jgi:hypothetical protein